MNIINKIKIGMIALFTLAALTGCGGGGGGGSDAYFGDDDSDSGKDVVMCTSGWTTVYSGDVVAADQDSQIRFDHDNYDNKKVCVVQGTATIL